MRTRGRVAKGSKAEKKPPRSKKDGRMSEGRSAHASKGGKYAASRADLRLQTFSHLESLLGPGVVRSLGASGGVGLRVVRETVEKGLPSAAVAELQKELAELGVPKPSEYVDVIASRATRARRDTLTTEQGERFVRIAGVLARALDVWEDEKGAADFLVSPHPLLDGDTPIDRARSELGARQVDDLLTKLDLGLPV